MLGGRGTTPRLPYCLILQLLKTRWVNCGVGFFFWPPLDLDPESSVRGFEGVERRLISVAGLGDVDGCKHRHPVQKCTNHNCTVLSTYGPTGSLRSHRGLVSNNSWIVLARKVLRPFNTD